MTEADSQCQLYVAVEAEEAALARLSAVLNEVAVAAVLIEPRADVPLTAAAVRALVEAAQARGAAALIAGDPDLARTVRADGVHLSFSRDAAEDYRAARQVLGERSIVGAEAGKSRHDAMVLAELGSDYVAFGAPHGLADRERAKERRLDLVTWWAELFEVPCVAADVDAPHEAAALAEAGADFVLVRIPLASPEAPALLKNVARAIAPGHEGG